MDIFWFWLFVVLLALHNGEEYAFIDRMASLPTRRPVRIPVRRFRIALAAVTLAGAVLPALKIAGVFLADRLLAGSAAVMLANAVFPHLVATIALRRYTAGVVTAVVMITPGSILILQAALRHSGSRCRWLPSSGCSSGQRFGRTEVVSPQANPPFPSATRPLP
jgi:hypothetical protein